MNEEFIIHFMMEEISLMLETFTGTAGRYCEGKPDNFAALPDGKVFLISTFKYFKCYSNGDRRAKEISLSPVNLSQFALPFPPFNIDFTT